ncbi:MAG TPA: GFA family protein [Bradyrhizobium sp.]|nr:GFA family protein [Bradyrhizobium sp.]
MAKQATAVGIAKGQCLCGAVQFEIDTPARWVWHDHSAPSRRAHGAAYATYVGSWRKRFRITNGKTVVTRFEDKATKTVRSFCARCGSPLCYERPRSPHMVNIPRALFAGRTGRQPLYHIGIEELQEWTYTGEPLVPLKGFPGVVWQRSKRKKRVDHEGMF